MPTTWDPDRYLQFADDRARPFVDLLARVPAEGVGSVVDLGCGPGQLTPLIRSTFPQASVVGVDSSPEMIEAARREDSDTEYVAADVATWRPDDPVDAIVSNALFQWLDDRFAVIGDLASSARRLFALQVPANGASPSHRLLFEIANREPYAEHTAAVTDRFFVDGPELYLDLFAGLGGGWTVDAWSTTYLHVLPGEDPVFDWISGTGARPVLQSLPDDLRERFEVEYQAALREAFPRQSFGTVLPFTRTFCVATRL